ncbi:hypothetical protein VI817_009387 [Penicillium citrinum]|nr:hypothetical protein VI817_009387 [Penicillium citrinum]
MAVDYIVASRHHPHHPSNYTTSSYDYTYTPSPTTSSRRSSYSNFSSNNPYAHFTSPSPTPPNYTYNRRSTPISLSDSWWERPRTRDPRDHPRDNERKRSSTGSLNSRSSQSCRRPRYPRTSQLVNPDIIDQLDNVTAYSYHHEGPYDAVCPERNRVSQRSPLEAVRESNEEALRATPRDKIIDCLNSHRPLDGTAHYPPGTTDREGQTYSYEEGSNMMNDYGNFMRLPGQKFTDEDFKNDPFYNRPLLNPFASLKRKLSLKRNKMRRSTA